MSIAVTPEVHDRIRNVQGVRPKAARIPSPGYYWLKTTTCKFYWIDKDGIRLDNPTHNQIYSVYTWEIQETSGWFIAHVFIDGSFDTIGSDETSNWESRYSLVTHVSTRIRRPEERSFMSSNVLTPEEEEIIRNASIASSCEIDQLLEIIHRLVKLLDLKVIVEDCDELFLPREVSEIRCIAREVAREEIQRHKDEKEVPF